MTKFQPSTKYNRHIVFIFNYLQSFFQLSQQMILFG